MKYKVNQGEVNYDAQGRKISGDDRVLLHEAIDLTHGKSWGSDGFTVAKFLPNESYEPFAAATGKLLRSLWQSSGLPVADDFPLQQYHTMAALRETHLAAVEKTKLLPTSEFPIAIAVVENLIADICKTQLVAKNPFDGASVFHFRVVRPSANDNNPLHRDVWLEEYANCINLYIPVAGSNTHSSLTVIPGSHHWPENKIERTVEGAVLNGVRYNVPAVSAIKAPFEVVRPDPKDNEVLVFSPYLIHGGAVNLNTDQTRISIELRLWKKG